MEIRFDDQVVVVTGASSGIGRAIALEFARCGADVVINYHQNEKGAREVAREIEDIGRKSLVARADVSQRGDVEAMIARTFREFSRIDILINNAGSIIERAKFMEISEGLWDRTLELNLKSVFLCSRAVVPVMENQGGGRIINICSGTVHSGGAPGAVHYAAAKGGVSTLTRGMAKELIGKNILVNGINPGIIATPLQDKHSTSEIRESFKRRIPLKREGSPEEVAAAAVFLASSHATYVVGEMMEVNGGILMV